MPMDGLGRIGKSGVPQFRTDPESVFGQACTGEGDRSMNYIEKGKFRRKEFLASSVHYIVQCSVVYTTEYSVV